MLGVEEALSMSQTAAKLPSFYDVMQHQGNLICFSERWMTPVPVDTPPCDFSMFFSTPRGTELLSVKRNAGFISQKVKGMAQVSTTVRVCFGIQTTTAIHKRSIEIPIMMRKRMQNLKVRNTLDTICKYRPLVLDTEVKNVKLFEETTGHKFFFSTDHNLARSVKIGRARWKYDIAFDSKILERRSLQSAEIAKFSQLDYCALKGAEKRVTKELSFLKHTIPTSAKTWRSLTNTN